MIGVEWNLSCRGASPEKHRHRKIGDKVANVLLPSAISSRERESEIRVLPPVQADDKKTLPNLRYAKVMRVQFRFENPKAGGGKKAFDKLELLIMTAVSQPEDVLKDKKIQIVRGI
jgi:hypothetical protein